MAWNGPHKDLLKLALYIVPNDSRAVWESEMKDKFAAIDAAVQNGATGEVTKLIQEALDVDLAPVEILEKGLRPAMEEIGKKFEKLDIFLPEMMQAADAMAVGVETLRPLLVETGGERHTGRIVLGTVQGDVHKIGKDIVRIMLEGAGFEVFDASDAVTKVDALFGTNRGI